MLNRQLVGVLQQRSGKKMDEVEQDTTGFGPLYVVAQASGFVAVVLTGVWMGHFRGGFAWASNPAVQFNWHPLLMVLSMVYLYGNGKEQAKILKDILPPLSPAFSTTN